jgi:hypothetical protein
MKGKQEETKSEISEDWQLMDNTEERFKETFKFSK